MRKEHLKKELIYKEAIGRYDVIFTYKDHIELRYLLPEEEKNFAEELMTDKVIKKAMKIYHFFYKMFGKSMFDRFCRETNFDFLLETYDDKCNKITHKGDVFLGIVEGD